MTTLAPPTHSPPSGPQLDLPAIAFLGRSLAEYAQFFHLDLAALRGCDVLDVAAGPSSFVAEACARRITAVAIDPLYGRDPAELADRVSADYRRMFTQIRAKPSLFRLNRVGRGSGSVLPGTAVPGFSSLAAAETDRQGAAQRFLADYAVHQLYGRYVAGALPRLPFFDGTFDLVLCAHLLFTYAARFDFDWHVAAGRELVRVTAAEVRIHSLCGADGKPYPGLARLRRELRASGIASQIVALDYEFFAGSNSMLVLWRNAP
ncbi:MAG: methyltransferase [Opitutus sp.]|nr:methyltransferase [Opitutus sp.]